MNSAGLSLELIATPFLDKGRGEAPSWDLKKHSYERCSTLLVLLSFSRPADLWKYENG